MELEKYVNDTLSPVLGVSDLWAQKTGKSWSEAKAMGLTDGSYDNNLALLKKLRNNEDTEVIPYLYDAGELDEIKIIAPKSKRIRSQQTVIKQGDHESDLPYAIVDKGENKMYFFGDDHNLVGQENIITGRDNGDVDNGLSMKTWLNLPENEGKTPTEYFEYLNQRDLQVTPSGEFTIGKLRTDVTKNPDKKGSLFNRLFRPQREKEIEQHRAESYGPDGKLFTLYDDQGVYSSKAIHGTGYKDRVRAIAEGEASGRDMSNGCINVKGETICFDTLEEGSKVFILPEEDGNTQLLSLKDRESKADKGSVRRTSLDTKVKIIQDRLSQVGKSISEQEAKKILIMGELESKMGDAYDTSKKVLDNIGLSKARGQYQINEQDLSDYLPEGYDFSDVTKQEEAVLNFVKDNADLPVDQLYNLFNKDGKTRNKERLKKLMKELNLR